MSKDPFWSKPRTIKEFARYYGVDRRTFLKWISCPTLKDVRPERGYYFSVNQVKLIINHLGSNEEIQIEEKTTQVTVYP